MLYLRKKILFFIFFFNLFFISFSSWADQLIIEPSMGREPILDLIRNAKQSIKLVMYGFTDEKLLQAVLQQKAHGRTVQIILEKTPYKAENENNKTINALAQAHIHWQGTIPSLRFIHQKTLIIDDKKALIMTFNFTHSTFKNERNFGLLIDDAKRVHDIAKIFAADWNQQPISHITEPLVLSPDNSRTTLIKYIAHAKHSIKIYAQNISDYKMIGALAKAAHHISVEIISSAKMREKQTDYLSRAGVKIRQITKPYIHAKVIIIDDEIAIIGSINYTRGSLDDNRELAIITQDKNVIQALNDTYLTDAHDTLILSPTFARYIPSEKTVLQLIHIAKRIYHDYLASTH